MPCYKDIQYTLKQSKRKTTSILIERDGSVAVLAPEGYDVEKVEQILEQKRSWIYRNLAEWEDLNRTHVERQFVSGEGFPYLGSNYRLKLVDDQQEDLILKNGYFLMRRDRADRGMELFKHFYRNRGLARVTKRVAYYAPKLGVDYRTVRVMELQHHWASCSTQGDLNFHWRCLMAPLSVLDYIVVHELAHRLHRHHNAAFWDVVDKVLPDYQKQVSWLKHNGAGMTL
ncbi:M48 family metallopeptidase [Aeromonas veronii bv. sobria]|uniref:Metal-dependent hydrolase n=1 Tax=Aeromonas veronii TaxID=654 RepID=A0ABY3MQ82_AERVE|nr:SprT family zinc-dependent metalloprotease [Aeromonas veronii]RDU85531.1 metal-dependent hydrolase [Aeromonas veronii]RDU88409.1 metal-dependent hydrolase [Aeromonas veronii]TEY48721.1 metal-dependent hydrolase [Aeromonas veronii]TEY75812.1 metal-dependent hydrolase [Aeromonas veronii]TYD45574.1 metal-dependent hydrolase [Aeromonas veronii]